MPRSGAGWCGWPCDWQDCACCSLIHHSGPRQQGRVGPEPPQQAVALWREGVHEMGAGAQQAHGPGGTRPPVLGGGCSPRAALVSAPRETSQDQAGRAAASAAGGSSVPGLRVQAMDPALCCVTPGKSPALSGPPLQNTCRLGSRGLTERQAAGGGVLGRPLAPTWGSQWVGRAWVSGPPPPRPHRCSPSWCSAPS